MVKVATAVAALLPLVAAWPTAMQMDEIIKRAGPVVKRAGPSTGRLNTGAGHPNPTFSEDQLVDVTAGSGNEFQSPSSSDLRGQCPGLNAAANHGFLPRNGKATIAQTVTGLEAAYNMSPDLGAVLAAISILLSGDIPSETWSIGGGFPPSLPGFGTPYGLLGTHDEYEGDASVVRGDAYLNGGNVNVFQMNSWNDMYNRVGDNLNLDDAAAHSDFVTDFSIANNPYYFSAPFSGLVAPAAANFVINFMSNHSAAVPGGTLTTDVLKSFFAVTGDPGSFQFNMNQERIPYKWYKRPGGTGQYDVADVFIDLLAGATIYPGTIRVGGNMGKVNTFTGLDVSNFTGGVYNGGTLLQGNNLACFGFQAVEAARVAQLGTLAGTLVTLLNTVLAPIKSATSSLTCPQLAKYDYSQLEAYPGYKYQNKIVQ